MIYYALIAWLGLAFSIHVGAQEYKIETLYSGSDVLWGFDFVAPNEIILSKRQGVLKHFHLETKKMTDLHKMTGITTAGQGGLLDILVHRIDSTDYIYFTYSKDTGENFSTTLARAPWGDGKLGAIEELFVAQNKGKKTIHYGSRLVIDANNHLFMTIGDRNERHMAQSLDNHHGKILRLDLQGKAVSGNPFSSQSGALPEIWSYGHRNPQGIALHPVTKELWSGEFGPRGGDEINLIRPGLNYGWPVVTYGKEYWGPSIGEGVEKKGMESPLIHFVPSLSYSGMTFYTGNVFTQWKGNLFLACLRTTHLNRIEFKEDGKSIAKQERIGEELKERIRQVRVGPDGFVYFSTDSGKLLRLLPAS